VAALFRLEGSRGVDDVRRVLETLIDWLKEPEQEGLRRAFVVWFKRVFLPARMPGAELPELQDLQEVRTMLAERVVEWTKQWEEEGMKKGIQQGIQQGESLVLRRLLARRFGPLPPWVEERLAQADPETLERWAERVLEAATLEEVFQGS
jgi:hypothetical protein